MMQSGRVKTASGLIKTVWQTRWQPFVCSCDGEQIERFVVRGVAGEQLLQEVGVLCIGGEGLL